MQSEKDLLRPTTPQKPADLGPELARLEQITNDLNKARHKLIAVPEGAQVSKPGEYSAPSGADGATTTLEDPIFGSPIPKAPGGSVVQEAIAAVSPPAPLPPVVTSPAPTPLRNAAPANNNLSRLFFTGQSGSGKSYLVGLLGAAEFTIQQPILDLLNEYFPGQQERLGDFINLVLMWGSGYVSDKVPITATRMLFADFARQKFGPDFGKPGFWTRQLLDTSFSCERQSVITTVTEESLFNALKEAGYTHYHIMASNPTIQNRARRKGANNTLATALDNQVMKALSMQRDGVKLKVIWCDQSTPPLSGRLYDVGGFLAEAKGATPVFESVAGE